MASVTPILCSCIECKKETSHLGIQTHYKRSHGSIQEKSIWDNTNLANNKNKNLRIDNYYSQPNLCKQCKIIIPYEKKNNIFCSSSCACSYSNNERYKSGWTMPVVSRDAIRNKLSKKEKIVFPFTKITYFKCRFCSTTFISDKRKFVCNNCQHLKYKNGVTKYSFKFNVFDFPDLFDLDLLKKVGWCSFGGKRGGEKNLNGLSRDHKVSVHEAKKNNYDPYFISHPCNCQLIPMSENNKKKTRSSITYNELVNLVSTYDVNRGRH
jgi:hypothetical protein